MLILLVVLLLISALLLRQLWFTQQVHNERLTNAHQQLNAAEMLIETNTPESAAALWDLHWNATQERYANYSDKRYWPRLHNLYFEPPYQLHNRIENLGGRANDGITESPQRTADSTLLDGLQAVIEELSLKKSIHSRVLTLATLWILPGLLLWALLYHLMVFRPMQQRTRQATSELNYKEHQLDTLAHSDALTETANRKAVTQFLSDYQRNRDNSELFVALAVLDLDYFQQINDVFGYFAGDAVLKEIAYRIGLELRAEDQLGRLDADHFAIVLCDLVAPKNAEQIIDRMQQAIARPIHYKQSALNITCTVGACVQRADSMELSELFKLSDQALLQAKRNRRGSVFLLSDQQQEALSRQRQIINTIKNGPSDNIFDLAFQPIFDLNTNQITACECLLRWTGDEPADLGAAELVPILEMFGDINEVGLWVLQRSIKQLRQWQTDYPIDDLVMSVNLSARQLEAEDFSQQIASITRELGVNPQSISLELTETVAIKHLEAGRHQLAQLRNMGFGVSLDDFGTGYSSLQYLKNMPATAVKIDQYFVKDMLDDQRNMAIVKGAIDIARAIGLKVIAEGIDTPEQADCLRQLGCDSGQGYFFSKALDADRFEQLLQHRFNTDTPGFGT